MAAISMAFSLLHSGDHIVTSQDLYIGTYDYLIEVADQMNIKTTFVQDPTNPNNFIKAMEKNTKVMIYFICLSFPVYDSLFLYIPKDGLDRNPY